MKYHKLNSMFYCTVALILMSGMLSGQNCQENLIDWNKKEIVKNSDTVEFNKSIRDSDQYSPEEYINCIKNVEDSLAQNEERLVTINDKIESVELEKDSMKFRDLSQDLSKKPDPITKKIARKSSRLSRSIKSDEPKDSKQDLKKQKASLLKEKKRIEDKIPELIEVLIDSYPRLASYYKDANEVVESAKCLGRIDQLKAKMENLSSE